MSKAKAMLLNAIMVLSFVNFATAAGLGNNLKTGTPAAELLASLMPSLDFLETITVRKVEAAPAIFKSDKLIAPGRDLAPKVEDPLRVKAILKLVGDIYNSVHLPYAQDGATFKNKERKLPVQPIGFYKEYTLLTGGAPHTVVIDGQTYQVAPDLSARGSERCIIGGGTKLYYTPDHYAHFIELTVVR
ncbi:MAG: hypothetical protein A2270_09490 [Elusimicrobia bacterium RIFOXYA12_FULL_51_18]|nr:MAG: hypothetical protein A2270_09490 [Elusimicrobia bacterium RIFOXYA12_FULL_51_18]OGS32734.1 MAG: hypothetical protein A2218_11805 [Elusimicrobia bacterium RIFOXYA2_FULL_53_38]